jgi:hypothetical protein
MMPDDSTSRNTSHHKAQTATKLQRGTTSVKKPKTFLRETLVLLIPQDSSNYQAILRLNTHNHQPCLPKWICD